MVDLRAREATSADLHWVESLLESAALPLDGVREHFQSFLIVEEGDSPVAAAGLEPYGDYALLRSVVVDESRRGEGIGEFAVKAALDDARGSHYCVFLRTETAPDFFLRFGFRQIEVDEVPEPVTASVEFQGACPETCVTMALELT